MNAEVLIPLVLLGIIMYGCYQMGRAVEIARAKGIPIFSKAFWQDIKLPKGL